MGNETSTKSPLHYRLLWGIVIALLITNVSFIVVLAGAQSFSSTVHVDLKSPFTATVAIDETFDVPIKTAVPIKTTVDVPVVIPILGQAATLIIPIDTTVPIVTTVSIPIKKSIPINISSPFSFDVPVIIKMSDTPFGHILQQLNNWLTALAARL